MKEPIAAEYPRLREDLTLFTYLHLAADEPLTRALVDSGITAIAYETVETADRHAAAARADERGRRPPGAADGRLVAREGARRPRASCSAACRACRRRTVVILGGGVVGLNAAIIALGMQADVWVLDKSVERMRDLEIGSTGA